jgi:hypothetical protein
MNIVEGRGGGGEGQWYITSLSIRSVLPRIVRCLFLLIFLSIVEKAGPRKKGKAEEDEREICGSGASFYSFENAPVANDLTPITG